MITRAGIGTLAAGGGLVAAVICLLVGLQLLFLGSEIGALIEVSPDDVGPPAQAWRTLVRMSGWLTLLAAFLVALLVVRDRLGRHHSDDDQHPGGSGIDDVTVRIFEVEGNRSIEIDPVLPATPTEPTDVGRSSIARPQLSKNPLDCPATSSATILDQIEKAGRQTTGPTPSRLAFLRKFFGRRSS